MSDIDLVVMNTSDGGFVLTEVQDEPVFILTESIAPTVDFIIIQDQFLGQIELRGPKGDRGEDGTGVLPDVLDGGNF